MCIPPSWGSVPERGSRLISDKHLYMRAGVCLLFPYEKFGDVTAVLEQ